MHDSFICENCLNCKVKIKLVGKGFKKMLVYKSVYCKAGMWLRENGKDFYYKRWETWKKEKKYLKEHLPQQCYEYIPMD